MAKASELSNQELVELIAKHEKVLRRLYKERDNRKIAGRDISFEKGTTSISKGFSPEHFHGPIVSKRTIKTGLF